MKQTHIPYGFISGILMVIVGLTLHLAKVDLKSKLMYFAYVPFLAGIIMNAIAYSKANDGFVTFGNVFGSCFKAAMIITIVMVGWSVISLYALPDMKEQAMAMSRESMAKQPNMTDEQIDMSMEIYKKYWGAITVSGTVLVGLFFGAIFSLVGAGIAKKKGARSPFVADGL